jgi:hypothetical protein
MRQQSIMCGYVSCHSQRSVVCMVAHVCTGRDAGRGSRLESVGAEWDGSGVLNGCGESRLFVENCLLIPRRSAAVVAREGLVRV